MPRVAAHAVGGGEEGRRELGIQLFERSASEVKITETGRRIVAQAERVLMEASQIQEIAAAGKDPLAGPLRVGVIYTIGPTCCRG